MLSRMLSLAVAAGFVLSAAVGAYAQKANSSGLYRPAASGNPVVESLTFFNSYDVIQVAVVSNGTYLYNDVKDCCISGDQWWTRTYCLQNGGVWDVRGQGRGDISTFTGSTVVYKNGSQPIECITEIRYGQGVSVFPAGFDARWFGNATITTTVLSQLQEEPLP